jgi:hypothetical protein
MRTLPYNKLITAFLFAVLTTLSGWSQQIPDSLLKYLEIAAKNNPVVLQKYYEYQAALQKVPQAGGLPDPELSAGVFLKPMELLGGNQVADLRLMQMFPWFGVLKSAKDEMSLMANAKFELFRDAKFRIFYEVQRTWYELYRIQKNINVTEKNIEILKAIERMALVKYQTPSSTGPGSSSSNQAATVPSPQNLNTGSLKGMQNMGGTQGVPLPANSMVSSGSMQSVTWAEIPVIRGLLTFTGYRWNQESLSIV